MISSQTKVLPVPGGIVEGWKKTHKNRHSMLGLWDFSSEFQLKWEVAVRCFNSGEFSRGGIKEEWQLAMCHENWRHSWSHLKPHVKSRLEKIKGRLTNFEASPQASTWSTNDPIRMWYTHNSSIMRFSETICPI
jgi:hypothetical protein